MVASFGVLAIDVIGSALGVCGVCGNSAGRLNGVVMLIVSNVVAWVSVLVSVPSGRSGESVAVNALAGSACGVVSTAIVN